MRVEEGIWDEVETILASGTQMAIATTGGGSSLLNWLFNHPGASRALLEAQIPYANSALDEYLGFLGPHRAEMQTARDMANIAYARARVLSINEQAPCLGVGLTAALATGRIRRGADRGHIALRSAAAYRFFELSLEKGMADRLQQEEVLSRFALNEIARQCEVSAKLQLPEWASVDSVEWGLDDPLDLLLRGIVELVEVDKDGRVAVDINRRNRLLFPGSFNPLHEGHCQLAAAAARLSEREVALEISVHNVDKPPLEQRELEQRLELARGRFAVCLTREPTFYGKARHFCSPHFVIGYDTVVRLLDEKYYEEGAMGMERALEELLNRACRFWVAGRQIGGAYRTLNDVVIPAALSELFTAINEEHFRLDISSTEVRANDRHRK
jgi:hypothetical protein